MLEEVRSQRIQRRVFRLATIPGIDELFAELDLDPQSIDELRDLLADRGHVTSVVELCDGPFRRKRKIRNRTRFSDGSFPVFYSSLEPSTAEAEVRHWFPQYSGRPQYPRTGYFQRFSCTFDGVEKDLRAKIDEWPDLIHDFGLHILQPARRRSQESADRWLGDLVRTTRGNECSDIRTPSNWKSQPGRDHCSDLPSR